MGDETSIEWTDATWNPIRGCSRVSPGCENCYAERTAARFCGPGLPYEGLATIGKNGPRWTGVVQLVWKHLTDPIRWRRARRIFVNSMSDLFHEKLNDETVALVFAVMAMAPHHTFQVLTKRPERMERWVRDGGEQWTDAAIEALARRGKLGEKAKQGAFPRVPAWPLRNVWLGTTIEDQKRADERIPYLLRTPAAVRFLSCEPLLEAVDLKMLSPEDRCRRQNAAFWAFSRQARAKPPSMADPEAYQPEIDWVIVGGESGPGARPFDLAWARTLVAQCRAASVPVFVKQLGAQPIVGGLSRRAAGITSVKGGDPSEWPEDLRVREMPAVRS